MNVSKSKIDVKIHRINIKTSKESFESSESSESSEQTLFELSKIGSNLSSIPIDQILNEINDSDSTYFKSS